jgi:hypothetical protein
MAQASKSARLLVLGLIAGMSDFMFVVALSDYHSRGAEFTACPFGCHTNVEALVAFGVIGLVTSLGLVGSILGSRQ